MPNRLTPLDFQTPAVELKVGQFTARWQELMRLLFGDVASVSSAAQIIATKTIAQLNALGLGSSDEGSLYYVSDGFGHLVRWSGSAWQWGPGDEGAGRLSFFAVAPDSDLWALCDGAATTYLGGIGTATLAASAFTTPNPGTDTFVKTVANVAAYTGVNDAAVAPTATASVAGDGTLVPPVAGNLSISFSRQGVTAGADFDALINPISVGYNPSADSDEVAARLTVTVTPDTAARPPSLGAPLYFRR